MEDYLTKHICYRCNNKFELTRGDIFYDGSFYHKKCDPNPYVESLGIVSKKKLVTHE